MGSRGNVYLFIYFLVLLYGGGWDALCKFIRILSPLLFFFLSPFFYYYYENITTPKWDFLFVKQQRWTTP